MIIESIVESFKVRNLVSIIGSIREGWGCNEGLQYFRPEWSKNNYCATNREECKYAERVPRGKEANFSFVGPENGGRHEEHKEITNQSCYFCNK